MYSLADYSFRSPRMNERMHLFIPLLLMMMAQGGLAGADLVEEIREAISKAANMGWSEQRPWLEVR